MYPASQGKSPSVWYLLAGLQAGVMGALLMLLWLGLSSTWNRRTWRGLWTIPNLMASTFYGDSALRRGFASTTFSGIALHVLVYAAIGALFGLLVRGHGSRLRVLLFGVLSGVAWYYLAFGLLWKNLNPLVPLYTPDRPMLVGHLLFGGVLGRFPVYLRQLLRA